jgi:hypothetical protein
LRDLEARPGGGRRVGADKLFLLVTRVFDVVDSSFDAVDLRVTSVEFRLISVDFRLKSVDFHLKSTQRLSVLVTRDEHANIHTYNNAQDCYEPPRSSEGRNPRKQIYDTVVRSADILVSHEVSGHPPVLVVAILSVSRMFKLPSGAKLLRRKVAGSS